MRHYENVNIVIVFHTTQIKYHCITPILYFTHFSSDFIKNFNYPKIKIAQVFLNEIT